MVTAIGCSPVFHGFESRPPLYVKMKEIIKKAHSDLFEKVLLREKKFDVRLADEEFDEGDILILKEIDGNKNFTGRELKKKITFVLRTKDCNFWNKEDINKYGFAILSLE